MAQGGGQLKLTLPVSDVALMRPRSSDRMKLIAASRDVTSRNRRSAGTCRWTLYHGDVRGAYGTWPAPSAIISDGAYGVGGFHGDPRTSDGLIKWYTPHIEAWSEKATAATTLWFWNTEVGWATVHSLLAANGWEYVQAIIWDKGIPHIAGNVNGDTIRQFPVVTELCVFYRRRLEFVTPLGVMTAKKWLRHEWRRTGLSLSKANQACRVRNAATRKYLTQDWLWYFPPPEMMQKLVDYANEHGDSAGRPYFSCDGERPITAEEWASLRHPWDHQHAVTNVWSHPPLNGDERYKGNGHRSAPRVYKPGKNATIHLNQKPISFMRRIISASTDLGDVVWEPFGGLCSASVAAIELQRRPFAAEVYDVFYDLARERLDGAMRCSGSEILNVD
ncbi:MAG: DNA methyltransferase [Candidatus Binataceae bacterium]